MKYAIIAIVGAAFLLYTFLRKSSIQTKGECGEKIVSKSIKRLMRRDKYYLIDDLLIRFKNSEKTTQLDHVLIGTKGIFVIETKNYSGEILGKANDRTLSQITPSGEYSFYNPIFQNKTHINALKAKLPTNFYRSVHGVVIFSGTAKVSIREAGEQVIYLCELKKYLKSFPGNQLSEEEIDSVYSTLIQNNVQGSRARRDHVKQITKKKR